MFGLYSLPFKCAFDDIYGFILILIKKLTSSVFYSDARSVEDRMISETQNL